MVRRNAKKGGVTIFEERRKQRQEEMKKLAEQGNTQKTIQILEKKLATPTTTSSVTSKTSPISVGLGRRKTRRSKKRSVTRRRK